MKPLARNKCSVVSSIKDFEETLSNRLSSGTASSLVCKDVDFYETGESYWDKDLKGVLFMGCKFPSFVSEEELLGKGANVWGQYPNIPFKVFRSTMYRQQELLKVDHTIYQYYLSTRGFWPSLAESMHDFNVATVLDSYLLGKTPVGIMGGHEVSRTTERYRQIVRLCRRLARIGFLIVTGGGPGAMEASNLGAYLADKTDEETELALELIAQGNEGDLEYKLTGPAENVIKAFGEPKDMPSLGIPTWRYGHEPSNRFATWHAKFFENAIREDGLLYISSGGLIYFPGSAGTRQELFQAACHNEYIEDKKTRPMVGMDTKFWRDSGVWDLFEYCAQDTSYNKYVMLTDSNDEVVEHLLAHAKENGLPLNPLNKYCP